MEDVNNVKYGNALFSVAMIDLKTYTEAVKNIDKKLEEANFILDRVLKGKPNEEYAYVVKKYAFAEYAEVQKYLKDLKELITKHMKRCKPFLSENLDKKDEFDAQLNILIPLFEEKEKFVEEQIQKCFEYLQELNQDVTV